MPAQKRPLPPPEGHYTSPEEEDSKDSSPPLPSVRPHQEQLVVEQKSPTPPPFPQQDQLPAEQDEKKQISDGDNEDEGRSPSNIIKDEFLLIKLTDIRKEVQCPICLGIIRKTRTVMECLHRFCRECIDKAMRLGNNECPACRTHCASRRSLRDDPNYDALIAVLYPDIDEYEKEELAFHEEETSRNKKIQEYIAETFRKQTEALGRRRPARASAIAFMRRSQAGFRRGRSRHFMRGGGFQGSDDEDEDTNCNDGGKDSSSADEHVELMPKRSRRWSVPRTSPALASYNPEGAFDEQDDTGSREARSASPGRVGGRDVLVWGKGGVRSQTRHGGGSGSNGKNVKGNRITKLVDYLRNLDENDSEFDVHLTLIPLDKETVPSLEHPHLCCQPTLSVGHLCKFIALQTSTHANDIEILAKKPRNRNLVDASITDGGPASLEDDLQLLGAQESIADLHTCFPSGPGDLVLIYRTSINQ